MKKHSVKKTLQKKQLVTLRYHTDSTPIEASKLSKQHKQFSYGSENITEKDTDYWRDAEKYMKKKGNNV